MTRPGVPVSVRAFVHGARTCPDPSWIICREIVRFACHSQRRTVCFAKQRSLDEAISSADLDHERNAVMREAYPLVDANGSSSRARDRTRTHAEIRRSLTDDDRSSYSDACVRRGCGTRTARRLSDPLRSRRDVSLYIDAVALEA